MPPLFPKDFKPHDYSRVMKHFGGIKLYKPDSYFPYATPGMLDWEKCRNMDWNEFGWDLFSHPGMAETIVDIFGAPALQYVMLCNPLPPKNVVERMLLINPGAADHQDRGMMDNGTWIHTVLAFFDHGQSSFSKDVDPEVLRLIVRASGTLFTNVDANGRVPVEDFANDDLQKLTPQTRVLLEEEPYLNAHLLRRHTEKRLTLGTEALRFCLKVQRETDAPAWYYKGIKIDEIKDSIDEKDGDVEVVNIEDDVEVVNIEDDVEVVNVEDDVEVVNIEDDISVSIRAKLPHRSDLETGGDEDDENPLSADQTINNNDTKIKSESNRTKSTKSGNDQKPKAVVKKGKEPRNVGDDGGEQPQQQKHTNRGVETNRQDKKRKNRPGTDDEEDHVEVVDVMDAPNNRRSGVSAPFIKRENPFDGKVICPHPDCKDKRYGVISSGKGCNVMTCTRHRPQYYYFCYHCKKECPGGEKSDCNCPKRVNKQACEIAQNKRNAYARDNPICLD